MADPNEQLRSLIDGLGNGGTAYLSRIACMNGEMARRRDNNAPGYFDGVSADVTVGQVCRGLMEFSADATARGRNATTNLLAPYRELYDRGGPDPLPQANQPAQALVNGFVDGSRRVYPNSYGLSVQLDGQGKAYELRPGAATDSSFTKTVSEYLAGARGVPNRITSWDEARVNSAVETCVRGRDTLQRCDAVGFEAAVIYIQRRAGQAATR